MKTRRALRNPFLTAITAVSVLCMPLHAQWVNMPGAGIPRGTDGKPNLLAPAPRLADGHPDLGDLGRGRR